jgi:hypothetical protein
LSDPTGTFGIKRNDTSAVIVADGTNLTHSATGTYEYTFSAEANVAYTAYFEFAYGSDTVFIEVDLPGVPDDYGMVSSYNSLLERVGHYLFGIRSGFSTDQTSDILECIRDGLHDVYTAHEWSFFRPVMDMVTTPPYATGTITVAAGVVTLAGGTFPSWAAVGVLKIVNNYYAVDTRDSSAQLTLEDTSVTVASATAYELGRPEYDLPAAFEAISADSDLHYEPGQSDFYPPVNVEQLSQLIVEACLAAAERNYEEQVSRHTERFREMLAAAIATDMERSSPTSLGCDAPRGEGYHSGVADYDHWARSVRIGSLTLDGDVL